MKEPQETAEKKSTNKNEKWSKRWSRKAMREVSLITKQERMPNINAHMHAHHYLNI
jgi:hypothetical protein